MAVPGKPTISGVITLGSNAIQLYWGAVSGAEGYYVYRSIDNRTYEKIGETGSTELFYIDANCNPATLYYYKVSAWNFDGEGPLSDPGSALTFSVDQRVVHIAGLGRAIFDRNYWDPFYQNRFPGIFTDGSIAVNGEIDSIGAIRSENNIEALGDFVTDGDFVGTSFSVIYFGDKTADGTWRIMVSSGNLVFQKKEIGVWNTKYTITA